MSYQPNIPTGLVNLDHDYLNIQNNFQVADTSFGENHYEFSDATSSNGKHKFIQMPVQDAPLVPTGATEWAIFIEDLVSGLSTTNEIFVAPPGTQYGVGAYPLTASAIGPINGLEGISFFPGGVYVQWGVVSNVPPSSGTVLFNTAPHQDFPNNCFMVIANGFFTGANPNGASSIAINQATLSKSKFDWVHNTNSGSYNGFYWIAIGN